MKKDDILLNEAYAKVRNDTIEEAGWIDRQKARLGALGSAARQGIGDVSTALAGKPSAPDAGWRGVYDKSKRDSILNTLVKNINTDLSKMGLFGKKGRTLNANGINRLKGVLDNWLNEIVQGKTASAPAETPSSPTPSAPEPTQANSEPMIPSPEATAPSAPESTAPSPVAMASNASTPEPEATTPSSPEATTASAPEAPATSTTAESEPVSSEPIPSGSKITDKNGTVYEYDTDDDKWYIPAKSGGSLNQIPNDREELQAAISNAWRKKQERDKATAEAAKKVIPKFESFSKYWNK